MICVINFSATPHAPQNARVTDIDEEGSVTLGWDPPAEDGGYPVLSYTVLVRHLN